MTVIPTDVKASPSEPGKARVLLGYLVHDKLALLSAIFLLFLVLAAIFGPLLRAMPKVPAPFTFAPRSTPPTPSPSTSASPANATPPGPQASWRPWVRHR